MRAPHTATVIDAGVGNLANLARALTHLGAAVEVTTDPARVAVARCLVLPGVGAFAPPRDTLAATGLDRALATALDAGAFLLGICVGFQLLFEASEEGRPVAGLGYLPGRVTRLPGSVPVPHIGWNRLELRAEHPLFAGFGGAEPYAYFVHGYAPEGVPADRVLATACHGREFPAVAGSRRVFGTQFHPEKSGALGLRLLTNYLEIAHGAVAVD